MNGFPYPTLAVTNELPDRPHSLEAEHAVLGALLVENAELHAVTRIIRGDDFFDRNHGLIFDAIKSLVQADAVADPTTVHARLGNKIGTGVTFEYLFWLTMRVPDLANVLSYAETVLALASRRRTIDIASQIAEAAANPNRRDFDEALAGFADRLAAIGTHSMPAWEKALLEWTEPDLAGEPGKVDFAVDGWIPAGKVGALVAAGGCGKTTLLLLMGICIALGRPFLGREVKKGSFLFLSNDDPRADLEATLALVATAMNLDEAELRLVSKKVRIVSFQGGACPTFAKVNGTAVSMTDFGERVASYAKAIPDLVGIAFDTLRQFCGGSSNDEEVIKITIAAASTLALKTGAFVIFPHHTGKQNYREDLEDQYAGSGSAALADNSRFMLVLRKLKAVELKTLLQQTGPIAGPVLRLVSTRGSLRVSPPAPMFLRRDGYRIEQVERKRGVPEQGSQHVEVAGDLDAKILACVRDGARTRNAIEDRVGGRRRRLLEQVDKLLNAGHIREDLGASKLAGGATPLLISATGLALLERAAGESGHF